MSQHEREPIEDRLARHAPDHADVRRLERSRRMLDDAVFLEESGVTTTLGASVAQPERRRGWRIAVPVAAAVGLGVGIVLWPSPSVTPSAFADWTEQPAPAAEVDPAQLDQCRAEAAAQELVVMVGAVDAAAAAEAERLEALHAAEAEQRRAEIEAGTGSGGDGSAGDGEWLAQVTDDGVVVGGSATLTFDERMIEQGVVFDARSPAVVDSRGDWTVSILVEDVPQRLDGGEGAVVGYVRTELTCMSGPTGTSVIGVSSGQLPLPTADDASLVAVGVADWPTWSQATGYVGTTADRVVVTLADGTAIDATVAPASASTFQIEVLDGPSSGDPASGTLEVRTVPTSRSFIAWWPTQDSGSRAVTITTYLADGTIGDEQQLG